MSLHNLMGRPQLLARINSEAFRRRTLSFYRYVQIADNQSFCDELYQNEATCKEYNLQGSVSFLVFV